ncbi:hypothetical protein IFM89_011058 [Coptis chinensis]|uniref:FBD domain-containing protein n=1 Tax=Coptis chinensis TaxID=261450 RepID=A0A835IRH5_9MAGN|nr:hypothetical protein IFM89_011058 [Coptis chinensis]
MHFVDRVLLHRDDSTIQKFSLISRDRLVESSHKVSWIVAAIASWPIKVLKLRWATFPDGDSNGVLTFSSSVLETLVLRYCGINHLKILNISTSLLKTLQLSFITVPCKVKICCPNLASLDMSFWFGGDFVLENVCTLATVDLDVYDDLDWKKMLDELYVQRGFHSSNCLRPFGLVMTLRARFCWIRLCLHVQIPFETGNDPASKMGWLHSCLGGQKRLQVFLEILTDHSDLLERIPDLFHKLRYLKLKQWSFAGVGTQALAMFLQRLPSIETIIVYVKTQGSNSENQEDFPFPHEFYSLKTFKIVNPRMNEDELKFLKVLLMRAIVLKEMVVKTSNSDSSHGKKLAEFREKLIALPRASASVSVSFQILTPTLPSHLVFIEAACVPSYGFSTLQISSFLLLGAVSSTIVIKDFLSFINDLLVFLNFYFAFNLEHNAMKLESEQLNPVCR